MNAIQVRDVWKSFRVYFDKGSSLKERVLFRNRSRYENRIVLKSITFQVEKGEAVGLIGRNGCGKSTLLKLLSRIMYPDQGTITIDGRVSSLIELGAGFHPDMSGRENIYTNASIFGLTQHEIDARLQQIIDFSELHDYIDNPVRTYSSGMYMRLAFSVAINVDADVLLIDEILAVGDAAFQAKCFRKLREIKERGTTIVIVSHSLGQIEEFCERSIWIEDGNVRMVGKPSQVHPCYLDYMNGGSGKLMEEEQIDIRRPQKLDKNSSEQDDNLKNKEEGEQAARFINRFQENGVPLYPQIPSISAEGLKGQILKPFVTRTQALLSPPLEQQGSANRLLAEGIEEIFQKLQSVYGVLDELQVTIQQLNGSKEYFSQLGAEHAFKLGEITKRILSLHNQGQYNSETLESQNFRLTETEKKLTTLQDQGQYNSETLESQNFRLTEAEKKLVTLQNQEQYNSEALEKQSFQIQQLQRTIENYRYQQGGSGGHYAQSGEDGIVEYILERLQIPLSKVTYLDLGANHAKYLSNTYYFYEHGSRGILVEANPQLIAELKEQRPGDIVLNRCISVKSKEKIPFYILSGDGLSSCDENAVHEVLQKNPELEVKSIVEVDTITVADILDQYFDQPPVLVNLDIEGMELEILKNFHFKTFRPLLFIVETIPYSSKLVVGEKEQSVVDYMKSVGYTEYAFTGINSIFIDETRACDEIKLEKTNESRG